MPYNSIIAKGSIELKADSPFGLTFSVITCLCLSTSVPWLVQRRMGRFWCYGLVYKSSMPMMSLTKDNRTWLASVVFIPSLRWDHDSRVSSLFFSISPSDYTILAHFLDFSFSWDKTLSRQMLVGLGPPKFIFWGDGISSLSLSDVVWSYI